MIKRGIDWDLKKIYTIHDILYLKLSNKNFSTNLINLANLKKLLK